MCFVYNGYFVIHFNEYIIIIISAIYSANTKYKKTLFLA